MGVFGWIDTRAQARAKAGLCRSLRPRSAEDHIIDLASNDYLGLAKDSRVTEAAAQAARQWGAGATGSRLVTGSTQLHEQLEVELADYCGFEAALVFSSGFLANLGVLTALGGPGTLLVTDAHNHASLIDGCRSARADVAVAEHNRPDLVENFLADRAKTRALVVTDSVFSVNGDLAPLAELAVICRKYQAGLVIDDAHGLGVVGDGRGAAYATGLAGAPDVVVTTTLSKSLGAQGGAVLGPRRVIDHLIDTARGFIFDTGLAPACVGGALAALGILQAEPELSRRAIAVAQELTERLTEAGLTVSSPAAAVVSVHAPSPTAAVAWANQCRSLGIAVGCFRPPSVPDRISRLRLTARANLSATELDRAVKVIINTAPKVSS